MKPPKEATHTLQAHEGGAIIHFLSINKPEYYYPNDSAGKWRKASSNIFTYCEEKPKGLVLKPIRKIQLENK